jgi:DNA-binding phage protein
MSGFHLPRISGTSARKATNGGSSFYLGFDIDAQIDYGVEPEAQEQLLAELRRVANARPQELIAKTVGISVRGLYAIVKGGAQPTMRTWAKIRNALARLGTASGSVNVRRCPPLGTDHLPQTRRTHRIRYYRRLAPVRIAEARGGWVRIRPCRTNLRVLLTTEA